MLLPEVLKRSMAGIDWLVGMMASLFAALCILFLQYVWRYVMRSDNNTDNLKILACCENVLVQRMIWLLEQTNLILSQGTIA